MKVSTKHGDYNTVKSLLDKGMDPNTQDKNGSTAILVSAANGRVDTIELLLKHNADPSITHNIGQTPLIVSAGKGHIEVVKLLLQHNVDLNVQDNNGDNALMFASNTGRTKIVELLLNYIDPNIKDNNGFTALTLAAVNGHKEIVELLLQYNADPNIQNNNGLTALTLAAVNGHKETVELLLQHNADPNIQDKDGQTALTLASKRGYHEIVKILNMKMYGHLFSKNIPNKCFDPIMYNDDVNINTQGTYTYFYITNKSVDKIIKVLCLDKETHKRYTTGNENIFYRCKDHVRVSALHIQRDRDIEPTPYRAFNFDIRFYVNNNQVGMIKPGKSYILTPFEKIGRIVSKDIVDGGSAVSGVHCGPATSDEIYSIGELVIPMTPPKNEINDLTQNNKNKNQIIELTHNSNSNSNMKGGRKTRRHRRAVKKTRRRSKKLKVKV